MPPTGTDRFDCLSVLLCQGLSECCSRAFMVSWSSFLDGVHCLAVRHVIMMKPLPLPISCPLTAARLAGGP